MVSGILVTDAVQANIIATYFGQQVETTLYFAADGGFISGDIQALADLLAGWVGATWAGEFSQDYTPYLVTVRDLGTTEGELGSATIIVTAEQDDHAGLPGNVSLAIARKTGLSGRTNRGRIFLVGLAENDAVGNTVDTTFANTKRDQLNGLTSVLAAAESPFFQVVVSRKPTTPGGTHGKYTSISEWVVVDYNLDSQRRRLNGRGS